MTKPLIYISGPFTSNPTANTHAACKLWESLRRQGYCTPVCPHWSIVQDTLAPLSHKEWIDYDLELIARCDAVYRMPGDSVGADMEVDHAEHLRIPVFYTTRDLHEWCNRRTEARKPHSPAPSRG